MEFDFVEVMMKDTDGKAIFYAKTFEDVVKYIEEIIQQEGTYIITGFKFDGNIVSPLRGYTETREFQVDF